MPILSPQFHEDFLYIFIYGDGHWHMTSHGALVGLGKHWRLGASAKERRREKELGRKAREVGGVGFGGRLL